MCVRKLTRTEWGPYFERYSRDLAEHHRTDFAEVRVLSPGIGVQKTNRLPLVGITYDAISEVLDIVLEGLDHVIENPTAVYVDEAVAGVITAVGVRRNDRITEVIEVR